MKKILQLMSILFLGVFLLPTQQSQAQDADPRISGTCTPHTQDQGPWDCKINRSIKVQCQADKSKSYDEVWRSVRNADEASEILKMMYLKLGGPVKFSQWLGCQGFEQVQMFSPAVEFPGMSVGNISIHIGIAYSPNEAKFPAPLWARFFAHGANFEIDIDNFGQIKNIRHGYTSL